jgi:hypothetical protein
LLSGAGPDTSLAWLPGVESVGPGKGDYRREGDHFRFAGRDSGDFTLSFALIGDSLGDYDYDNDVAAYQYQGQGRGRYVVGRQVRLPERLETYAGVVAFRPLADVELDVTGALSRHSRNLFALSSGRTGLGYDARVGWQRPRFGVSYERRELDSRFRFPGLLAERDFDYHWNLDKVPASYSRDQAQASVRPSDPVQADLELGWLRAESLDRKRAAVGVRAWFADYRFELVGRRTRHSAGLAPRVGVFYPQVQVKLDDDTLQQVREVTPGLGFRPRPDLNLGLNWQRQWEQGRDSTVQAWQDRSRLDGGRTDAHVTTLRHLDVQAAVGYQQKTAYVDAGSSFGQLFYDLNATYAHPAGVRATLILNQEHEQTVQQQVIFVPAEHGQGSYSRNPQTGEYYPDTLGDFDRKLVPSGTARPARTLGLSFDSEVSAVQWLRLVLNGSLDQQVSDSVLLIDDWSGDLSIGLWPNARVFSATLSERLSTSFDQFNSYLPERRFRHAPGLGVRLGGDARFSGSGRFELPYERRSEPGGTLKSLETGIAGTLEPFIGAGVAVGLKVGYSRRDFAMPGRNPDSFRLHTLSFAVSRRFEFRKQAVLNLQVNAEHRAANVSLLPYEIGLAEPLGWSETFAAGVSQALGDILVLSGNYTFTRRPDSPAGHNLSAGLRAYF